MLNALSPEKHPMPGAKVGVIGSGQGMTEVPARAMVSRGFHAQRSEPRKAPHAGRQGGRHRQRPGHDGGARPRHGF